MPPVQPPAPSNFDPSQLLTAISGLKDDIVKEMDSRFATYDEKLASVDRIDNILSEAQKAQAEELERRKQAAETRKRAEYKPETAEQLRRDAAEDAYQRMVREQEQARLEQDRQQQIATQEEAELDQQLDRDIHALRKAGYLPEVVNPNDPNDPGRFAEDELLARAAELETPKLDEVARELSSHHRNNEYYDLRTRSYKSSENILIPLAGKTAPVGNSSISTGSPSFAGPTSAELRNMDFGQLAELAKNRGAGPLPVGAQPANF